mmetsp:Transcript_43209/g.100118  ORF Transcript_43209/g.100118 Transcript_43209/m.100118 type:complete len:267 (-) Transcript_43209:300-1100(-)
MPEVISVEVSADGVGIVTFSKEPVNTMDFSFWQELLAAFEGLEANPQVRAVIFRSGLKRDVFTAGLDVNELYAPNSSKERLFQFWGLLSKVLTKIYMSPMVTAAAIKGACPAGGCALALCCDVRVISANGSLGLNETQLGLEVPVFWVELFASIAGCRQAERLLELGEMPSSEQLLRLSMVDTVADTTEQVLPQTLDIVRKWLKVPDAGRAATKKTLRRSFGERWAAGIEEEAGIVWESISDPKTVAALGKVLERLSGGGKKTSKL